VAVSLKPKEMAEKIEKLIKSIFSSPDSKYWAAIAGTGLALSLGIYGYCKRNSSKSIINDERHVYLDLLFAEVSGMIYAPSITTASFYSGDITESSDIQGRVEAIIESNPWLSSEVVGSGKQIKLRYCKEHKKGNSYQEIVVDIDGPNPLNSMNEDTPIDTLTELTREYWVKKGYSCIGKPEPLFKVTVVKFVKMPKKHENNHPKVVRSVLLFSLSHLVGDGYTFYTLFSYLDPKVTIKPLNAVRKLEFPDKIDEVYGKEFQQYLTGWGLVTVIYLMLFGKKPLSVIARIDPQKLRTLKKRYQDENGPHFFVSTNDLITSWFFRTVKASYGMMCINFRNRWPRYTSEDVGNYEGVIMYHEEDYQSPVDIRQSVKEPYRSKTNRIPCTYREYFTANTCVITNWATFYHHLTFPHAQFVYHCPLAHSSDAIVKDMMVIYAPNLNETAVYLLTRSLKSKQQFYEAGKELFME
jgi:hypothetical protein